MKKSFMLLLLIVLFVLPVSAFAQDDWKPIEYNTEGTEAIECEIQEPRGMNEAVMEKLSPITEEDWSIGPEDAVLTILEYADFQCPYCSNAGLHLLDLQAKYPDKIRYVYRHFILSYHDKAPTMAYGADAAGRQGKFFDAEYFIYSHQNDWSSLESVEAAETWLKDNIATGVEGLDYDQWLIDFEDTALRANIDSASEEVYASGLVEGTPTVFLNFYQDNYDEETIQKYIDLFDLQKRLYTVCPANFIDAGKEYRAVIDTSDGQIVVDLFADQAPLSVNNFISLAEDNWFDGLLFHRIVPGFIAQTGDPSLTGVGNPGYFFKNEENTDYGFGEPGMVGMANSGADKNGSQFFITFDLNQYYLDALTKSNETAETPLSEEEMQNVAKEKLDEMNAGYTIFGKVTEETYPVVEKINAMTTIMDVVIEEKAK